MLQNESPDPVLFLAFHVKRENENAMAVGIVDCPRDLAELDREACITAIRHNSVPLARNQPVSAGDERQLNETTIASLTGGPRLVACHVLSKMA